MTRDNLPADWGSYSRTCSQCGESYHDSGVDECACIECDRCGEVGPSDSESLCASCVAHIEDGGCAASGCDEPSVDHGDGTLCWEHVVEQMEADIAVERAARRATEALVNAIPQSRDSASYRLGWRAAMQYVETHCTERADHALTSKSKFDVDSSAQFHLDMSAAQHRAMADHARYWAQRGPEQP